MANINQLPYQKMNNNKNTNKIAHFLLKKVKKTFKRKESLSLFGFWPSG